VTKVELLQGLVQMRVEIKRLSPSEQKEYCQANVDRLNELSDALGDDMDAEDIITKMNDFEDSMK
jgi:hypothetical protein